MTMQFFDQTRRQATSRGAADAVTTPLRIVICGGGAGGLPLATMLQARAKQYNLAVTLVDPSATHVWKPLLHEFASGSMDKGAHEIAYLALAAWHGFTFSQGPLQGIDREKREVLIGPACEDGGVEIAPARHLPYDCLVVAVGGITNDFGIPGVQENAFFLDSSHQAEQLHREIVRACMRANYEDTGKEGLDICIVGGGATGVELAAELRSTTRMLLAYGLTRLDPERFVRLTLLNADPRLLLQLPEHIANSVDTILQRLGVKVLNATQVTAVEKDAVVIGSGERLHSDVTVWAAGVKGPPFLADIGGLETGKLDRLILTPTLQTTRDPQIFALGDCAATPWLDKEGQFVPPRAQAAFQQAAYLSRAIPRLVQGETVKPFRYNDLGSLVSLGDAQAIGTLMGLARGAGIRIEGFLARLLYKWLYKRHQAALFGWWAVALDSFGRWIGSATRPRVKLH
jgi:NADH:ubiquinone reductase (H+-translocating)